MQITDILAAQRAYFQSGATLDVDFRIRQLKKLYAAVEKYEAQIGDALRADLGKSNFEGFMCETGMVLTEISHMIRYVRRYARARTVPTPMAQFPSRSYVQPCPYGNVLIMSPWNYPFLLTLDPLVTAIAAGNTAVIKPSAYSPATSQLVQQLVEECFEPQYVAVVTGGREENAALLQQKFDFIFFTGSQNVGKEVLRRAAEYLTPAVLELGGKSPCIVDSSADISLAARRIVFGKFLNCGQTCVAPDYILCDRAIQGKLVDALQKEIKAQFGTDPLQNPDYGKIINRKHFDRVCALGEAPRCNPDTLQIAPTILPDATWDSPAMQEEIFGPILPVLTYEKFDDIFTMLRDRQKPLALYLFSSDKAHIRAVTTRLRYGGGCVNDVIIHLATSEMGFGGVGESGMGAYHGKVGFDTFSHLKSIVDKKTWLDLPMRYQPYRERYEKLLRFFLK